MEQSLRMVVIGRVQGVGYRDFTRRAALRLGLRGWVRNAADGSVELEVSGPVADLAAFEHLLRQGPPHAQVIELRRQLLDVAPARETFEIVFR